MSELILERKIPQTWVFANLDEIRVNKSKTIVPNKTKNKWFELYSVPSCDENKPEIVTGNKIRSNKQTVTKGTVLLCKINPRINRVWVVDDHSDYDKIASTEWITFFKQDGIDPKYLFHFLKNETFRNFLSLNVSGVGGSLTRIKPSILNHYQIPIPPLNEQKRIVAKIEESFSELEHTSKILEKIKKQLKQHRQSLLKSTFTGKLTQKWRTENTVSDSRNRWDIDKESVTDNTLPKIPNDWCWRTLEQISNGVVVSFVGPTSKHYVEENEGIMFLRSQNVRKGKMNFNGMKYVDKKFHQKEKKSQIKPGNLLIVRVGANRGDSCIAPNTLSEANAGNIIIARVFEDISYLLNYYFQSNFCQKQMIGMTTGSAQGVINTTSVSQTLVPIPSLNEQTEMIKKIEEEFSLIKNIENAINSMMTQIETIRSSILTQAFEGKLVPQNSNDESAEILLQKIKQEKEQLKQKEKPKKSKKNVK